LPGGADLKWTALSASIAGHLRFRPPSDEEARSYNVLQRLTYAGVVFILAPLMVWTGLAMSPAISSVFPGAMSIFGGQQSARTIHFLATVILVFFLVIHIAMVYFAGFRSRMRAMITGRASERKEHP
jgi:thiosulfate reductase cytochrome b subunit